MLYVDFNAGNNAYKLRLNTQNIVAIEKALGCNPLMIFGKGDTIPGVTTMVTVLHASLQQFQHNITMNEAYKIFDAYLADGNSITDFIPVIIEIYQASGIMPKEEKN